MRAPPVPPTLAAGPDTAARRARAGFARVVQRRILGGLLLIALANALAGVLTSLGDPTESDRLALLGLLLRSTMISGCCVMLAAAAMEALIAVQRWSSAAAHSARLLAVVLGALMAGLLRIELARSDMPALSMPWGWFVANATVWTLLGGLAVTLLTALQDERDARNQLLALQRQQHALEAQEMEAQLSALNAQIEPHFLFNTLAHVKRLYATAPADGRNLLGSLITYLRAALPAMRSGEGRLGQELEQVRSYLSILQTRMSDRLRFQIDAAPEIAQARLPTMVLHTLVENAIKHGLASLPEGGEIRIVARQEATGQLTIEVRDNGAGFSGSGGSGVGLANTRARLAAMFGAAAGLELEAAQPRGLIARLRLPLQIQATTNDALEPAA